MPIFVPSYKPLRTVFLAALLLPFALQAKDPLPDGSQLARSIRELVPEKNMEIRATMEVIVRERKRLNTDVVIQVEKLGQAEWQTTYTAKRDEEISDYWRVSHGVGKPNRYEKKSGLAKQAENYSSLAGSCFFIADLGMDFLHWPSQVVLKTQRRKSRLCYVLESRNLKRVKGEYHRVVSWVDIKSRGILLADIYSGEAKPVKRFSVKGLSKKNAQWQVDEMEMRDTKTGTRSRLHFHLE